MLQVLGKIDGRHAPLAELALDTVAALQGGVESHDGVGCIHSGKDARPMAALRALSRLPFRLAAQIRDEDIDGIREPRAARYSR